jgi:hypothetical protein
VRVVSAGLAALLAVLVLPGVVFAGYALRFRRWYEAAVRGTGYFGRPSAERRAFAEDVARRAAPLRRVAAALAAVVPSRFPDGGELRGIRGPIQCGTAEFERAAGYRAGARDVFVATQMKCGTTWMQQLVYEVLSRGRGDLSDAGARHLYAVSPWIEARWSVRLEDAPPVGPSARRVIKTHMPTPLLPIAPQARYVYVTRHPVACFASCADFVGMLMGPAAPSHERLLSWFCSERMWWGPWPDHVDGWWRAAQSHPNVLFVHFEEMKADLAGVVDRVADFLGEPLSADERAAVVQKSSFDFMKVHEERFTMAPPTPFQGGGSFLRSGRADRHADVGAAERERILAFCRERLRGAAYPAARFYPDLA